MERGAAIVCRLPARTGALAMPDLPAATPRQRVAFGCVGVIETRGRHGTFVSVGGDLVAREAFAAAVDYADRIRRLGLGADDARRHLDAAFRVG